MIRNDVASFHSAMMRCLPMCRKAHIIAEGNIIPAGYIICPSGQTSFKKLLLSKDKRSFLLARKEGFEVLRTPLAVPESCRPLGARGSFRPLRRVVLGRTGEALRGAVYGGGAENLCGAIVGVRCVAPPMKRRSKSLPLPQKGKGDRLRWMRFSPLNSSYDPATSLPC